MPDTSDHAPPLPTLRRSTYDPVVTEDALQQACVLVGLLSGRYTKVEASRALGVSATAIAESVASAGQAGDDLVKVAIEKGFTWSVVWGHHAEQAIARAHRELSADAATRTLSQTEGRTTS